MAKLLTIFWLCDLTFVSIRGISFLQLLYQILSKFTYANRFPLCVPQIFSPKFDQNFETNSKEITTVFSFLRIYFTARFCLSGVRTHFSRMRGLPPNPLLTQFRKLQPSPLEVGDHLIYLERFWHFQNIPLGAAFLKLWKYFIVREDGWLDGWVGGRPEIICAL